MAKRLLTCPECRDDDAVHPSHLRLWDVPFLLIGMRTYRCLICYRRFRAWGRLAEREPAGPIGKKSVRHQRPRRVA